MKIATPSVLSEAGIVALENSEVVQYVNEAQWPSVAARMPKHCIVAGVNSAGYLHAAAFSGTNLPHFKQGKLGRPLNSTPWNTQAVARALGSYAGGRIAIISAPEDVLVDVFQNLSTGNGLVALQRGLNKPPIELPIAAPEPKTPELGLT